MPYSFLPALLHLRVASGAIELVFDDEVIAAMTPEEARANARDLLDVADQAQGIPSPTREIICELLELIRHGGLVEPAIYRALALLLERERTRWPEEWVECIQREGIPVLAPVRRKVRLPEVPE